MNSTLHRTSHVSEVYLSFSLEWHMVSYKIYGWQESHAQGTSTSSCRIVCHKGLKLLSVWVTILKGSIIKRPSRIECQHRLSILYTCEGPMNTNCMKMILVSYDERAMKHRLQTSSRGLRQVMIMIMPKKTPKFDERCPNGRVIGL